MSDGARIPTRLRTITEMSAVDAAVWDGLVDANNPFVRHDFLLSLEASGSATAETGWQPVHVLAEDDAGVIGAMPAYLKDHSHGEYIFDWGWADGAMRARIPYYPKLVAAVPFTPATGPRLLLHPTAAVTATRRALADGAWAVVDAAKAHSAHVLFCEEGERDALAAAGWTPRASMQYHWTNAGYRDFEDLLDAMVSRRRKEIRRERKAALSHGLDLAVERVSDLSSDDLDVMWRCYEVTIERHHAIGYLREDWWRGLADRLGATGIVATARRNKKLVAMALAFTSGKHLYGRYWGTTEDLNALHFELCYYQLLDYAIANGMTRVEAGAQGEHKVPRGFLPSETFSAHRIVHPGLSAGVAEHVVREATHVRRMMAAMAERSPFRSATESP
jgi:predicted N-acyltransferase